MARSLSRWRSAGHRIGVMAASWRIVCMLAWRSQQYRNKAAAHRIAGVAYCCARAARRGVCGGGVCVGVAKMPMTIVVMCGVTYLKAAWPWQ